MYLAKKSFAGKVIGNPGKPFYSDDKNLIKELLSIGYIVEVPEQKQKPKEVKPKEKSKNKK